LPICSTVRVAKAARLLVSALVLALALTAAAPSGAAVRRVQIYFLQGEQVVPVQRRAASVGDAVRGLIAGPNAKRAPAGLPVLPAGTKPRSARVVEGVAQINMSEIFAAGARARAGEVVMRPAKALALVLLALAAAATAGAAPQAEPTKRPGILTVGVSLPSTGFQAGAVRGRAVVAARGLEIDLARSLAGRLRIAQGTISALSRRWLSTDMSRLPVLR
jgi:hypothetical protein